MNKRTLVILSSVGFVIGCLSGVFSYVFFERITLEAVILPFVLVFLGVSLSFLKEDKKKISLVFFFISLILYLGCRGYLSAVIHKAETKDAILYMVIGLIPFFLLSPFFFNVKKNRSIYVIISLFCSLILFKLVLDYTTRYIYLYEWTSDHSASKTMLTVGSGFIFVAVLSKLIFDTKRNYLSYFSILAGGMCYGIENSIRLSSYSDLLGIIKGSLSSSFTWWMMFSFIIFIILETKKEREFERRNIIFKDIVYQELKPIKKRKRIITFEVPPNVPKFKHDFTLEKKNEIINNEQND